MKQMQQFFKRLSDWIFTGKRRPVIIVVFIVAAVAVIVAVVSSVNKPESSTVTVFVTVEGLDDGKTLKTDKSA